MLQCCAVDCDTSESGWINDAVEVVAVRAEAGTPPFRGELVVARDRRCGFDFSARNMISKSARILRTSGGVTLDPDPEFLQNLPLGTCLYTPSDEQTAVFSEVEHSTSGPQEGLQREVKHQFAVKLSKPKVPGTPLGLVVVPKTVGLVVAGVADCCDDIVPGWNREHPDHVVQPGDVLARVNNETEIGRMTEELLECVARGSAIELSVERVLTFSVCVDKIGPIGLSVTDGDVLRIMSVRPGIIEDYNFQCAGDKMIVPGDRLVAINGTCGSPGDLLNMLIGGHGIMCLTIERWCCELDDQRSRMCT